MMPQQPYYHPQAYYGPGGNNQHMSYVPVDNSGNEGYLSHSHSQGQNHQHKLHHDAHHSGPHSVSSQGANSYNKGRRKQQQPPPQPNYYYANPQ